jgi:ElaB/YqjD/DUF883 family membrane-anchored ribosome-binding protein
MKPNGNHSVEDLRRESERTRAQLVSTVVELREKVGETAAELKARASPAHIKQEVRSFVREEQRSLMQTVQERVRENPLQAAAVGAMLAYPAWGLLRAIPAPLLLIGAGLWLTGAQGKRTLARTQDKAANLAADKLAAAGDAAGAMSDRAQELAGQAGDTLAKVGSTVAARAGVVADEARHALHDGRDAVAAAVRTVRDGVQDAVRSAGEQVNSGAAMMADARGTMPAKVTDAVAAGRQSLDSARERVVDRSRKAAGSAIAFVEENPLLVAGIGLAAGAFLGSALPASETEKRVLGKASDLLKAEVGAKAARAVQRASEKADEIGAEVAAAAEREGLGIEAIKAPVAAAVEGVRNAAERGLEAAFPDTAVSPEAENTGSTGSGS